MRRLKRGTVQLCKYKKTWETEAQMIKTAHQHND